MARTKLAEESEFIPADLGQARLLLKALRAQGTPNSQARGIVAWLVELPDDLASNPIRAAYRAELARLATPPWRPGRGDGRASEDGSLIVIRTRGARRWATGADRNDVQVARAA